MTYTEKQDKFLNDLLDLKLELIRRVQKNEASSEDYTLLAELAIEFDAM